MPAVYGAALLAGLFAPSRGWHPAALALLAGFTGYFAWLLRAEIVRSEASDLARAELGLLGVLAGATVVQAAALPVAWASALFATLIVLLSAAVPAGGLLALPPAAVLVWAPNGPVVHLVLLEAVAAASATVAWFHRRSRRRLQASYDKLRLDAEHLGAAVQDRDPVAGDLSRLDEALQGLLTAVREATGAHGAVLVVRSPGGVPFVREVVTDAPVREDARLDTEGTAFKWIFDNGRPLKIDRLRSPAARLGYYAGDVAVRSFLGVPVGSEDRIEGVLGVDSLAEAAFTDAHEGNLRIAAHQVVTILRQGQVIGQERRRANEFSLLHDFSQQVAECETEADLLDQLLVTAGQRVACSFAVVLLCRDGGRLRIEAVAGPDVGCLERGLEVPGEGSLVGWVAANCTYLRFQEPRDRGRRPVFARDVRPPEFASLLLQPLDAYGKALGVLCLASRTPRAFGEATLLFAELLAKQGGQALQHQRHVAALSRLATTDGLTGLANRRVLFERLEAERARSHRYEHGLALALLDVDHFKQVNDRHGHPAGDEVLRQVAAALRELARETDLPARHGGEEFAIVLPATGEPGARALAERLRERVQALEVPWQDEALRVTASLGVSALEGEADTVDALVSRADRALYAAKEGGRNRVVAYSEIREYVNWDR